MFFQKNVTLPLLWTGFSQSAASNANMKQLFIICTIVLSGKPAKNVSDCFLIILHYKMRLVAEGESSKNAVNGT